MSSAVAGARLRFAPILTATVLTILMLWLVGKVADVLVLLLMAVLISLYLGAVTDFFTARLRLPRPWALVLAVLVSLTAVIGLLYLLVPPVIEQTRQLVQVLPSYIESWEAGIDRIVARFPALGPDFAPGQHRVLRAFYDQISGQFEGIVPKVFSLVHGAISIFSVAVMGLYLALHPGTYREWLIALFPPVHRDLVRDVLGDLSDKLRRFIVGQLLTMTILAALTTAGLYLLQVPYALTFGIFTGAVAIVPFFGTLLSTTLPALFVLGGHGVWGFGPGGHASLVVLLGVVIHLIEGNIVSPKIMSDALELPPVLTIITVLIVGKLLGGVGLVVALPLLAITMVIVQRILINRIYEGHGFRRTARDRTMVLRVPAPEGGVLVPEGPPPDVIAIAERAQELKTA